MTLLQLMREMEALAPAELAEEWDNVGLMCGDPDKDIGTVVVALDADAAALAFAKEQEADVIVSHHPLIFSPVKRVVAPDVLYQAIRADIAVFSAHTNLDKVSGGVNDTLAARLGLVEVADAFDGIGRVGVLPEPLSSEAFAALVKDALGTAVQWRKGNGDIKTVALVSGSGGDFVADTTADAFVTGEVKHHEWLQIPDTMTVVCAGHYATEVVVVETLCRALKKRLRGVKVVPFVGAAPYQTI